MPVTIALRSTARASARSRLREREQLAHERSAARRGALDLHRVLLRAALGHVVHEQLRRRQDRGEQVVEVVGDTARELADRFETLRTPQRFVELGLPRLGRPRLGHVADQTEQERRGLALDRAERREAEPGVANRTGRVAQPQRRLAHLLRREVRQPRPVRVGRGAVLGVDERGETAGRRHRVRAGARGSRSG